MSEQEPQFFELDPESAPRMTAVILLVCGLLGIGFLLVNVAFTGDDPYYNQQAWEDGTEEVRQRYDVMPNLLRGRQQAGDSDEDEEAADVPRQRAVAKKATTGPVSPYQELMNRITPPTPGTPGTSSSPGSPSGPLVPGAPTPAGVPAPGLPSATPAK
jgi:hypothetical protein